METPCECPYDAAYTCRYCLVCEERKVAAALAAGENILGAAPEEKTPACFHCADSGIECDYCGTPAREG